MKTLFKTIFSVLVVCNLAFSQVGNEAPDFSLDKLSGGKGMLSDYPGKVVYINWFGYSCPTCLGEGKATQEQIVDKYSDTQIKAFGIDVWNGTASQVQSFKNSTSIKYELLLKGSATASDYGVSYQYSIVIDQQGIIQYYGRSNKVSEINAKIQDLLTATAIDEEPGLPVKFGLKNNYPNPFNPQTNIPFSVDKTQDIKLAIYNISGQLVRTLINAQFAKGTFEAVWDGKDNHGQSVASGIYFSRLQGEGTSSMKQLVLLK